MAWGRVDDESLAEARELIGTELRRSRMGWNTEVNADNLRQYVWGIGEDNPLFLDDAYGASSVWGSRIAPGTFLYSIDITVTAPKLAGVQWIHGGNDWTFFRPIRLGEKIRSRATLVDVEERSSSVAQRWALQTGEISYLEADSEALIATSRSYNARTPRGEELKKAGFKKKEVAEPPKYSEEQLEDIARSMLEERVRGAEPLYFEEVEVGDSVAPLLRGPLTQTDIVAWYCGTLGHEVYGGPLKRGLQYRTRHADYMEDPGTGQKLSAGRGHLEPDAGVSVGMGGGYDTGPMRPTWIEQLLTGWSGDAAFVHQLDVKLKRPNNVGQTSRISADVVDKRVSGSTGVVELDVRVQSWEGDVTAAGRAAVLLPIRERGQEHAEVPVGEELAAEIRADAAKARA
jgi:acyl dehydratase